jgi:hypothetical protein
MGRYAARNVVYMMLPSDINVVRSAVGVLQGGLPTPPPQ